MLLSVFFSWCSFITTFMLCCKFYPSDDYEENLTNGKKMISREKLKEIFQVSLINLSWSLPVGLIFYLTVPVVFEPPWWLKFPIAVILFDFLYYYLHYCFHNFNILKTHHDMHHEYNLANPVSTYYSSKLEALLLNTGTVTIVPFILGFKEYEMFIWFTGISLFVSMLHSRIVVGQNFHMIHHFKRYYNYGLFGISDLILGSFYTKFKFDEELNRIKSTITNSSYDLESYVRGQISRIPVIKNKKLF